MLSISNIPVMRGCLHDCAIRVPATDGDGVLACRTHYSENGIRPRIPDADVQSWARYIGCVVQSMSIQAIDGVNAAELLNAAGIRETWRTRNNVKKMESCAQKKS